MPYLAYVFIDCELQPILEISAVNQQPVLSLRHLKNTKPSFKLADSSLTGLQRKLSQAEIRKDFIFMKAADKTATCSLFLTHILDLFSDCCVSQGRLSPHDLTIYRKIHLQ
jgi:hypothetical protein